MIVYVIHSPRWRSTSLSSLLLITSYVFLIQFFMHCSSSMRNISSLIMAPMSGRPEHLVAEDEQETIRGNTLKNPRLEFVHEIAQSSPLDDVGVEKNHPSPKKAVGMSKEEEEEDECGATSFREEHKLVEDDGEINDGFRTPTSSDNKIPEITECPPAPMKPKLTKKRKLLSLPSSSLSIFSDDRCREEIDVDIQEEVESLFRPIHRDGIKKARRDGNNN